MDIIKQIDTFFFRTINSSGWHEFDNVMILISSKWLWIPLYLYILFNIYKKFPDDFYKICFALTVLIFISDYGSVEIFKNTIERNRPCYNPELQDSIRIVDGCGGKFGFISSHASNAFSLAFFISLIFRNFLTFLSLFTWAILIGFSRIYLGVHYPGDIIGGMFWGFFVSLFVYKIYKMKIKNFDIVWIVWLILVCLWNFGWENAPPLADVIIAMLLSLVVIYYKKRKK